MRIYVTSILTTILTFCVSLSIASAQQVVASTIPDQLKPGFESITTDQCEQWLNILAGPEFEGRGTGQTGYTKAAHWVSGKVAEFGLEPMGGGGSYFQMLPMARTIAVPAESRIEGPNGLNITGAEQLGFQRFTDQPQVSGTVAFVAVTGENPQLPADVSLRDKVVVLSTNVESDFRTQVTLARQQPAAVIRIAAGKPENQSEVGRGGRNRSQGIWSSISPAAAQSLIEALEVEASWIQPAEQVGVVVNEIEAKLSVSVRLREEKLIVPNVIAWLEGSDPDLKDEYIVLGAHLDHLGTRGDQVYNGADDNGSGSTAILSVARAMSLNPVRPKRSVMFIWFAAEEIGLVGSRYYVDNPTRPLENIVCMFNCDMVGRNQETASQSAEENQNTIQLIGSQRGQTVLHDIMLEANQHINLEFRYEQESVFGRSDQASFYEKGIPVAFLFSGFHPDYHQPSDETDKINFQKIASVARLCYLAIHAVDEHGRIEMTEE